MRDLDQGGANWYLMNLMPIQALALEALGREEDALSVLSHCLTLAEPEGYVRAFLERGAPMARLLQIALRQGIEPKYITELLSAFKIHVESYKSRTPASRYSGANLIEPLIEPLSERELEVLRFLNTKLSTPEIACEMILAPSTIRTDATVIDLCASIFDWAQFRRTKGAVKLHLALDHDGYLPSYAYITTGKVHEVKVARARTWPSGTILTFDRGFVDFAWFGSLIRQGVWFVTGAKSNITYRVIEILIPPSNPTILKDEIIELTGYYSYRACPYPLRRIEVMDPETGEIVVLLSSHLRFSASTISALYKDRCQIDIVFRNLKQHLRIKTFVGTSANALHIQIWTALIAYLLLWYLKMRSKYRWSMSHLFALVRMNLFSRKNLWAGWMIHFLNQWNNDVAVFGSQRARLHPYDNICEKRVFLTPQLWDPDERAFRWRRRLDI